MSHKKDARLIWVNTYIYKTDVNSGDPYQMPHSVASVQDLHCLHMSHKKDARLILVRASDFFQDWWVEVTHGAKNGGSLSELMGPSISN